ncbi:zinc carboxypeptidase [Xylariaceae sp. FL1019]|nr:zinc carboxypeptidase [Xylariaceae sp. FL1019]
MKFSQASSLLILAGLAHACLLPEERAGGSIRKLSRRQQDNHGKAVGKGDRFKAGKSFPRGIGSGHATDMSTILNVKEVDSGLAGLAAEYGIQTFETPFKTYESRTISGARVGGKGCGKEKYHVYLNGAIHARERGSHDSVLYFISDLLYAQKHKTGLVYGNTSYTHHDVEKALATGIVFTPLINPDGVTHDQKFNDCWRKNRNPESSDGDEEAIGIDLNRNFDFVWDLDAWAPSVANEVASEDPTSEVFHGTAPFSEPETANMKWVLDTFKKVRWFIDLHSYTGDILYSWGSDTNQETQPYKSFLNSTYDDIRGLVEDDTDTQYGEYIPAEDQDNAKGAADRMAVAMTSSTGREYLTLQAAAFYPTSGASDDYSFSRHFADRSLNKVYGYTVEFGFGNDEASCPFYPTEEQYILNLQETNAGFMEFLLAATDIELE